MKKFLFLLAIPVLFVLPALAEEFTLSSPNGGIQVKIDINNGRPYYSVETRGRMVIAPSGIGFFLKNGEKPVSKEMVVAAVKKRAGTETIPTPFYRSEQIAVAWNELDIRFKNHTGLLFRAYNEGVAYRFYTDLPKAGKMYVLGEQAEFNFDRDYEAWVPYSPTPSNPWCMSFQTFYTYGKLSGFNRDNIAFLPLTVDLGEGLKVTLAESDLAAYPGMFIRHPDSRIGLPDTVAAEDTHTLAKRKLPAVTGLCATFARYPRTFEIHPRRCQKKVTSREEYLAVAEGNREYPWRVIAVTGDDRELPVHPLVYALASPNQTGDVSWIKPGKIAWDWWNDWGVSGVDFKVGINTATYKYFIDFAAENGIEYVVLDEGWSEPGKGDVMVSIPDIDVKELVEYGRSKNVGIILWTVLNVLDDKLEQACEYYSGLGVKGFKVDFLDRDDQEGIEMLYRVAEIAARHKLLIDFHGSYKPTGLNRTFPNIINIEGVFGLEELKWSQPDMPLYDVTMPFIRMMCGPVDYTQGAMRNATRKEFRDIYTSPMSQGTRAHQVATYVVFDSPLVTLCDSPTAYRANAECTAFITSLPVVFDETVILQGKIGEYIVTARRVGDNWYIGGLTNWDPREIELPLDFLDGNYKMDILQDGINAAKVAQDYKIISRNGDKNTRLKLYMAPGGGFAIRMQKQNQ